MRKIIIIIISSCIVALLLGYAGYRGYRVWKQNHWLALAKDFASKGDLNSESLSLQQVLRANPQNVEACRMMANLAEAMHMPTALAFRERVVESQPQSLDDRLALVQTAMMFKDYATATNAMAAVDEAGRNTVGYQNLAGVLATGSGQVSEALKHFSEALRLEPDNPVPQMNLAVLQLHSSNKLDQAEARIRLQRLSLTATNANVRFQVQRQIVMDSMRNKDFATALSVSKELAESTNAPYADRLLRLDVLKDTKNDQFKPTLERYEHEAANNPARISDLGMWMISKYSLSDALAWLHTLPAQFQTNQPATLIAADCYIGLKDWHGLQVALQNQNWDESEYARHAYLAKALREQGLAQTASAEWSAALQFAGDPKRSIGWQKRVNIWLFTRAVEWKWINERDELLWAIVNQYPEERWAAPLLSQTLIAGGRTRPLMQLLGIMVKRDPDNLGLKNDLAMTAMLLNAQELNPYEMAKAVYQKEPKLASFAATYAFSLYLQKQYAEALKVMNQLKPEELKNPAIAGYYGLILKANGDRAGAAPYLALAAKGKLMPEEKQMFDQAAKN